MQTSTPFENIYNYVDALLSSYVTTTSEDIIVFINPIFTSLLIIWITIWGFSLMLGRAQEPLSEGFVKIIKISFIVALGLSVGTYNSVVVSFLQGFPETIASILMGGSYSSASALDQLYSKVFEVASKAWEAAGVFNGNFGLYLIAIAIGLIGGFLVLTVGSLILLSKMATAILLGIGPIFIVMLLFSSTQRFFESWLAMLINFALILILATAIGSLIIDLADKFISTSTGTPTLAEAGTMCLIFGFAIIVMKQVQAIASALGGGISLATNGAASAMVGNLRPSSIKRGARNLKRDYNATKSVGQGAINSTRNAAATTKRAYQRVFKSNSISN